MVVRTTSIIPDLRKAFFRCASCGATAEVAVDRGRVEEPAQCTACSIRHSMVLVHNRCTFKDKQLVKLQETPESIPEVSPVVPCGSLPCPDALCRLVMTRCVDVP
jgi:DNA replication licensing factor MCM4